MLKKALLGSVAMVAVIGLSGCGGGGSSGDTSGDTSGIDNMPAQVVVDTDKNPNGDSAEVVSLTGYYKDSAIQNVDYKCGSLSGKTEMEGTFKFEKGQSCTFSIGTTFIRTILADKLVDGMTFWEDNEFIAGLLQALDADGNLDNGILIDEETAARLATVMDHFPETREEYVALINKLENIGVNLNPIEHTLEHLVKSRLAGQTVYFMDDKEVYAWVFSSDFTTAKLQSLTDSNDVETIAVSISQNILNLGGKTFVAIDVTQKGIHFVSEDGGEPFYLSFSKDVPATPPVTVNPPIAVTPPTVTPPVITDPPITCDKGERLNPSTGKCEVLITIDPCEANPELMECQEPPITCDKGERLNPSTGKCEVLITLDPCEANPELIECQEPIPKGDVYLPIHLSDGSTNIPLAGQFSYVGMVSENTTTHLLETKNGVMTYEENGLYSIAFDDSSKCQGHYRTVLNNQSYPPLEKGTCSAYIPTYFDVNYGSFSFSEDEYLIFMVGNKYGTGSELFGSTNTKIYGIYNTAQERDYVERGQLAENNYINDSVDAGAELRGKIITIVEPDDNIGRVFLRVYYLSSENLLYSPYGSDGIANTTALNRINPKGEMYSFVNAMDSRIYLGGKVDVPTGDATIKFYYPALTSGNFDSRTRVYVDQEHALEYYRSLESDEDTRAQVEEWYTSEIASFK